MLPTLNFATMTNPDVRGDLAQNLVPRDAVRPLASFAESLRSSVPLAESGRTGFGLELSLPPDTGKLLPAGGKGLPADLRALVDELKELLGIEPGESGTPISMQGSDGEAPLSLQTAVWDRGETPETGEPGVEAILRHPDFPVLEAQALDPAPATTLTARHGIEQLIRDRDPAAAFGEVRLPPGLEFRTRLTPDIPVGTPPAPVDTAAKARLLPAGPVTGGALDTTLRQIAGIVDVPEAEIQTAIENRAVPVAELKRIVDELKTRLAPAEPKSPAPAATVRLDGTMTEARPERFRALGVGQPSPSFVGLDIADAERPGVRQDVLVAESLHKEGLTKPQPGGLQIHAASVPASQANPTQFSLGQTQQFQPVDVKLANDAIQTPVRDPAWGDRLGERVVMMANNRLQNVDIRLSPAELGPLRVSVSLDDGAATVSFVAQHAVTREAIEQALPRLRSMLEESGIDLGQASVEQDGPHDGKAESDRDGDGGQTAASGGETEDRNPGSRPDSTPVRLSRGLLDTFV